MALTNYRDLEVWKKSMELVVAVCKLTRHYPADERFGLTAQSRDAATSIPSNIAEGYGRLHRGDYLHHLSIAKGSLAELETQLILAVRLEFVSKAQVLESWELSQRVGRMLTRLMDSLGARPAGGRLGRGADTRHPKPETRVAAKVETS